VQGQSKSKKETHNAVLQKNEWILNTSSLFNNTSETYELTAVKTERQKNNAPLEVTFISFYKRPNHSTGISSNRFSVYSNISRCGLDIEENGSDSINGDYTILKDNKISFEYIEAIEFGDKNNKIVPVKTMKSTYIFKILLVDDKIHMTCINVLELKK